jgi:hypothetical protein
MSPHTVPLDRRCCSNLVALVDEHARTQEAVGASNEIGNLWMGLSAKNNHVGDTVAKPRQLIPRFPTRLDENEAQTVFRGIFGHFASLGTGLTLGDKFKDRQRILLLNKGSS